MQQSTASLQERLQREAAVLVRIERFEGSSPREVGAWMLVFAADVLGTVGGGNLEFQALAHARECLTQNARELPAAQSLAKPDETRRYALGPSLGQCCGGLLWLSYSFLHPTNATKIIAACAAMTPANGQNALKIALFGGGHVGKAIARVLGALPCALRWVDSRDEIFPPDVPLSIECIHSDPVQREVQNLAAGSLVLIMSFSHAEDLDIVAACLTRLREKNDLPFIGLIGSKTKWATFQNRLRERGFMDAELAKVTSPIGVPGVRGKEPEVIAVAVAAQLMQWRS
jgi:xanthine dehydrogenase accessory factor